MNKAHEQLVDAQFGPRAKAYLKARFMHAARISRPWRLWSAACDRRALSTSAPVAAISRT